ncbi:MarR family transcriptional regulator [Tessaracoccus aquimaris]|uniref:MarR family transcriptional regulator n=1 Tax=Tessaracoccus aquimaris TaxID=1332264 RepID=A0A1Q2CLZ4_9ACTN|nr:MarR family transcriptional regulator [Tessaracoccus aquimaris]
MNDSHATLLSVNESNQETILAAACFRLGLLGARITQEFSVRVEEVGITHKQVGLLAVVSAGLARSQRDIASLLHVAPSLVVSLVDQLIEAGAVTRSRSATDRRVQVIELTDRGRGLLAASTRAAADVDAEFRAGLSPAGRSALDVLLLDLDARHPVTFAES